MQNKAGAPRITETKSPALRFQVGEAGTFGRRPVHILAEIAMERVRTCWSIRPVSANLMHRRLRPDSDLVKIGFAQGRHGGNPG